MPVIREPSASYSPRPEKTAPNSAHAGAPSGTDERPVPCPTISASRAGKAIPSVSGPVGRERWSGCRPSRMRASTAPSTARPPTRRWPVPCRSDAWSADRPDRRPLQPRHRQGGRSRQGAGRPGRRRRERTAMHRRRSASRPGVRTRAFPYPCRNSRRSRPRIRDALPAFTQAYRYGSARVAKPCAAGLGR